MDKITSREKMIMDYLKNKDWTSPTEIGEMVWNGWNHSSTASPVCLRMVKKGLLVRNKKGHYKLFNGDNNG